MKVKTILLFIIATLWIEYNYIPTIPIGFLLVLLWVRPKTLKQFTPLVVAMILGLLGTGISFQFFKSVKTNPNTGKEYHLSKSLWGFNLGTKNLTHFLNRDVIKLYQDDIYTQQQQMLDNHLRKLTSLYNLGDKSILSTPFGTIWKEYGEIEDMYHFGNLNYFIPDIYKKDVLFVYKIKFSKQNKEQTIHLRVLFYDGKIEITKAKIMDADTKYDVRQRIVIPLPTKKIIAFFIKAVAHKIEYTEKVDPSLVKKVFKSLKDSSEDIKSHNYLGMKLSRGQVKVELSPEKFEKAFSQK